jgi:hypothetical protein
MNEQGYVLRTEAEPVAALPSHSGPERQAGDANKEGGVKPVDLGQHSSLDLPLSLAQL